MLTLNFSFHKVFMICTIYFRLANVGVMGADESRNHKTSLFHTQNSKLNSMLSIDIIGGLKNGSDVRCIRVHNKGDQNEFISMQVMNAEGHSISIAPSEFPLASGSFTEIPLKASGKLERSGDVTFQNFITVLARGKRDSVSRSFAFGGPYDGAGLGYNSVAPFCIDKDVTGTCRYRSDPEDCFKWHWTAYATILNQHGSQKISSIPEGLLLGPEEHPRVRVYLKVSCCSPVVQFIATDLHYGTGINSCVIDVRELQNLHPGEIAGIVIAAVLLLVIIIIIVVICARRRRREKINHVGMLPRVRSAAM